MPNEGPGTQPRAALDPMACPACGHVRKISDDVPLSQCPACKVLFAEYARSAKATPNGTRTTQQKSKLKAASTLSQRSMWLLGLGSITLVALTISASQWLPKPKSSAPVPEFRVYGKDMAKRACEGFVVKNLKAPATAVFSEAPVTSIAGESPGPFTIVGYVDAQNSFGANLRNHYTCTLTFDGDLVKLENIEVR
jgi:hypothetical protein